MTINTPFKFGDIVYKVIPDRAMKVDKEGNWNIAFPEVQLVLVKEDNFFDIINEWNTRYFISKQAANEAKEEFQLLCMSHGKLERYDAYQNWLCEKIHQNIGENLIKL